jgi:hypothetical protein
MLPWLTVSAIALKFSTDSPKSKSSYLSPVSMSVAPLYWCGEMRSPAPQLSLLAPPVSLVTASPSTQLFLSSGNEEEEEELAGRSHHFLS